MFYIRVGQSSVVYTGDYNMTPDRHLGAAWIDRCRPDLLITESTYATTIRDSKRCRERDFLKKIHETVDKGGKGTSELEESFFQPILIKEEKVSWSFLIDNPFSFPFAFICVYFSRLFPLFSFSPFSFIFQLSFFFFLASFDFLFFRVIIKSVYYITYNLSFFGT